MENLTLDEMIQRTNKRSVGFMAMIDHLKTKQNPVIIETGCMRQENNFEGDGMSTLIFDTYCQQNGGEFWSVDLSQENVDFAKSKLSVGNVVCENSLNFLYKKNKKFLKSGKKIDLLYLDSYDFDVNNPHPSALHHMMELTTIIPSLSEDCLIVVDDNIMDEVPGGYAVTGKGVYILEYFNNLNVKPHFLTYQFGWKLDATTIN